MYRKFTKIIFFVFILFGLYCAAGTQGIKAALLHCSDLLTTSAPSTVSNHTITFFIDRSIPPSGQIIVTPESGFFIDAGMNYTDVDLATSSSSSGPFIDRELANNPSATEDGASIDDFTPNGSITLTLNSTFGIATNTFVQIEAGTNATYGTIGDTQIYNQASIGSYKIDIDVYDELSNLIGETTTMVAIVQPVTVGSNIVKIRGNGSPGGFLTYGTTQTILSMETNFAASCRYSRIASTSYAVMTDEFTTTGTSTASMFHSVLITGLSNGQHYNYYIRCEDASGVFDDETVCLYEVGEAITKTTCTDYLVSFDISAQEGEEGEESGEGAGGGGGGRGGGRGGGGGGGGGAGSGEKLPYPPPPEGPGVILEGWAYPLGEVFVLKDGQSEGAIRANQQGEFSFFSEEYDQGVYTFSIWGKDIDGRTSNTYSTTFWIDEGTQTTVSDIFLAPTIQTINSSVNPGELIDILGQSVPGSTVEVWLFPNKGTPIQDEEIIKQYKLVGTDGRWGTLYNTDNVQEGRYKVKARSNLTTVGYSGFSRALEVTIGTPGEASICGGADLNGDGRVNITDFSILLYYWGTDDACADQNNDGNVDLIDFSIMMYYWTG